MSHAYVLCPSHGRDVLVRIRAYGSDALWRWARGARFQALMLVAKSDAVGGHVCADEIRRSKDEA